MEGNLSEPFLNRFIHNVCLRHYEELEVADIVKTYVEGELDLSITDEAAIALSNGGRLVPRVAKNYASWIRDFIQDKDPDREIMKYNDVVEGLKLKGVDEKGMTDDDYRYLALLQCNWPNAMGLKSLAKELQMDETTIENVIEPYLLRKKLISCTSGGRVAND